MKNWNTFNFKGDGGYKWNCPRCGNKCERVSAGLINRCYCTKCNKQFLVDWAKNIWQEVANE